MAIFAPNRLSLGNGEVMEFKLIKHDEALLIKHDEALWELKEF